MPKHQRFCCYHDWNMELFQLFSTGKNVSLRGDSPKTLIAKFLRMFLKRGMENGEWGMGNGEWGMGNGEWRMRNSGQR